MLPVRARPPACRAPTAPVRVPVAATRWVAAPWIAPPWEIRAEAMREPVNEGPATRPPNERTAQISRGGGMAVRSFGGRVAGPSFTGSRIASARISHGGAIHGAATHRVAATGTRTGAVGALHAGGLARTGNIARAGNVARAQAVFGQRAISNVAWRSHFGSARFHGGFCCSLWPWWSGGIVIGWFGPLFWPYAYYDFFDYVFWPYAYDDFWPYAYNDIYYGIYGPYAYSGYALADPGPGPGVRSGSARRVVSRTPDGTQRAAAD